MYSIYAAIYGADAGKGMDRGFSKDCGWLSLSMLWLESFISFGVVVMTIVNDAVAGGGGGGAPPCSQ